MIMPKTGLPTDDIRSKATSVALDLIRHSGYEKFRLLDVAREMNISHAALYKYFKNKEDLTDSVNEVWLREIDDELEAIVTSSVPVEEKIVEWSVRLYTEKRKKVLSDIEPFELIVAATYDKRPFIEAHLKRQADQLQRLIDEALRRHIMHGNKELILRVITAATEDYHHPSAVLRSASTNREQEIRFLMRTLLSGLANNTSIRG